MLLLTDAKVEVQESQVWFIGFLVVEAANKSVEIVWTKETGLYHLILDEAFRRVLDLLHKDDTAKLVTISEKPQWLLDFGRVVLAFNCMISSCLDNI